MKQLFAPEDIAAALDRLAPTIVGELGADFTMVPILTGGFVFGSDLARALYRAGANPEVDFLQLSSYGAGRSSSGDVKIVKDVAASVEGRTVLLVDDVLDTGRSLNKAHALLSARGASRIATVVAVNKPQAKREAPIVADFSLFTLTEDAYLVGYGLDDAGRHRGAPGILAMPD